MIQNRKCAVYLACLLAEFHTKKKKIILKSISFIFFTSHSICTSQKVDPLKKITFNSKFNSPRIQESQAESLIIFSYNRSYGWGDTTSAKIRKVQKVLFLFGLRK